LFEQPRSKIYEADPENVTHVFVRLQNLIFRKRASKWNHVLVLQLLFFSPAKTLLEKVATALRQSEWSR